MNRDQKLEVHLDWIIFHDLPEGTRLNGQQIAEHMANATMDQRERAFQRALERSPLLLDEERDRDEWLVGWIEAGFGSTST
jgi:hypothetical protein